MIKRLLSITAFLWSLQLMAQVPLSSLYFQEDQDSLVYVRVYEPGYIGEDDQGNIQNYDLGQLDLPCAQHMLIAANDHGYTLEAPHFWRKQHSHEKKAFYLEGISVQYIFGFSRPQKLIFDKTLRYISYPAREGQSQTHNTTGYITVRQGQVGETWHKILTTAGKDSLILKVNLELVYEVDLQQKTIFNFGERLSYPVNSNYKCSIVEVSDPASGTTLDLENIATHLSGNDSFTYIDIFNSFKGIWMAQLCKYKEQIKYVDLISQPNFPINKRLCQSEDSSIQVYPNPTFGNVNVLCNQLEPGDYFFELYNIIGQRQWRQSFLVNEELMVHKFNLPNPQKGTFLYAIVRPDGKKIFTRRLSILGY